MAFFTTIVPAYSRLDVPVSFRICPRRLAILNNLVEALDFGALRGLALAFDTLLHTSAVALPRMWKFAYHKRAFSRARLPFRMTRALRELDRVAFIWNREPRPSRS